MGTDTLRYDVRPPQRSRAHRGDEAPAPSRVPSAYSPMSPANRRTLVRLADGGMWSHTPGQSGLQVRCASGNVWLTQTGEAADAIIRPGESFVTRRGGKVVVQAIGDVTFTSAPAVP